MSPGKGRGMSQRVSRREGRGMDRRKSRGKNRREGRPKELRASRRKSRRKGSGSRRGMSFAKDRRRSRKTSQRDRRKGGWGMDHRKNRGKNRGKRLEKNSRKSRRRNRGSSHRESCGGSQCRRTNRKSRRRFPMISAIFYGFLPQNRECRLKLRSQLNVVGFTSFFPFFWRFPSPEKNLDVFLVQMYLKFHTEMRNYRRFVCLEGRCPLEGVLKNRRILIRCVFCGYSTCNFRVAV